RRGVIFRRDGDAYHGVAFYNASPELIDFIRRHPIAPGRDTITARVALERRTIHVADLQPDAEYRYALRDIDPIRTELGVPMFRGDDIVGVVILYKLETPAYSTSCGNRCSNRPPPPTCSRSSAARPSISGQCYKRLSNPPFDFVKPTKPPLPGRKAKPSFRPRLMASRRSSSNMSVLSRWCRSGARSWDERYWKGGLYMSPM